MNPSSPPNTIQLPSPDPPPPYSATITADPVLIPDANNDNDSGSDNDSDNDNVDGIDDIEDAPSPDWDDDYFKQEPEPSPQPDDQQDPPNPHTHVQTRTRRFTTLDDHDEITLGLPGDQHGEEYFGTLSRESSLGLGLSTVEGLARDSVSARTAIKRSVELDAMYAMQLELGMSDDEVGEAMMWSVAEDTALSGGRAEEDGNNAILVGPGGADSGRVGESGRAGGSGKEGGADEEGDDADGGSGGDEPAESRERASNIGHGANGYTNGSEISDTSNNDGATADDINESAGETISPTKSNGGKKRARPEEDDQNDEAETASQAAAREKLKGKSKASPESIRQISKATPVKRIPVYRPHPSLTSRSNRSAHARMPSQPGPSTWAGGLGLSTSNNSTTSLLADGIESISGIEDITDDDYNALPMAAPQINGIGGGSGNNSGSATVNRSERGMSLVELVDMYIGNDDGTTSAAPQAGSIVAGPNHVGGGGGDELGFGDGDGGGDVGGEGEHHAGRGGGGSGGGGDGGAGGPAQGHGGADGDGGGGGGGGGGGDGGGGGGGGGNPGPQPNLPPLTPNDIIYTPYMLPPAGSPIEQYNEYERQVNFQRIIIMLVVRFRNGVDQSDNVLQQVLDLPYFQDPWDALLDRTREPEGNIRRSSWSGSSHLPSDYRRYTDFRLDAISTNVRCMACTRRYTKAKNLSDVMLMGNDYDDLTFAPVINRRRQRKYTLGTCCFKTWTEVRQLHHMVYLAFLQFEDDNFLWSLMDPAVRREVTQIPVNIDNIVASFEQGYRGDRFMLEFDERLKLLKSRRSELFEEDDDQEQP